MAHLGRTIAAVVLALAGIVLAGFFWLLFAITDCSADCVARGERAVPLALVGTGAGLVVSAFFARTSAYRAVAFGLMAAGVAGAAGIAWIMAFEGSRGQAVWLLGGTVALVTIGAGMKTAARDRAPRRP